MVDLRELYDIYFYLNDGEQYEEIGLSPLEFVFDHIILHIDKLNENENKNKNKNKNWAWGNKEGEFGWADISVHADGKTYIRIQGIGDPSKGQTYYIVNKHKWE